MAITSRSSADTPQTLIPCLLHDCPCKKQEVIERIVKSVLEVSNLGIAADESIVLAIRNRTISLIHLAKQPQSSNEMSATTPHELSPVIADKNIRLIMDALIPTSLRKSAEEPMLLGGEQVIPQEPEASFGGTRFISQAPGSIGGERFNQPDAPGPIGGMLQKTMSFANWAVAPLKPLESSTSISKELNAVIERTVKSVLAKSTPEEEDEPPMDFDAMFAAALSNTVSPPNPAAEKKPSRFPYNEVACEEPPKSFLNPLVTFSAGRMIQCGGSNGIDTLDFNVYVLHITNDRIPAAGGGVPSPEDQQKTSRSPLAPLSHWYWTRPEMSGHLPSKRSGHTARAVGHLMYVFGGYNGKDYFGDVNVLNTDTMRWDRVYTAGTPPFPRTRHTFLRLQFGRAATPKLVVFGGGDDRGLDQEPGKVFILDTAKKIWSRPMIFGDPPCPRWGHTAIRYGDTRIAVVGGHSGPKGRFLNDVFLGDLRPTELVDGDPDNHYNFVWTELKMSSESMPPRMGHTASYIGSHKIVVYGGTDDNQVFNDIWLLDLKRRIWQAVERQLGSLPRSLEHSAALYNGRIVIWRTDRSVKENSDRDNTDGKSPDRVLVLQSHEFLTPTPSSMRGEQSKKMFKLLPPKPLSSTATEQCDNKDEENA
ncbi:MAG: hypothetical protein K1060chlam1_00296 [Candidatus Anoxychlamydiales bacterium]|nr:hypothetical protein [Candidatus Anoxychlamydiales bacterium]